MRLGEWAVFLAKAVAHDKRVKGDAGSSYYKNTFRVESGSSRAAGGL